MCIKCRAEELLPPHSKPVALEFFDTLCRARLRCVHGSERHPAPD